eukprot:5916885-Prymnesium_polylepis.1
MAKRSETLAQRTEMLAAAADPSRLTDRAKRDPGRLLREEKLRNAIEKALPNWNKCARNDGRRRSPPHTPRRTAPHRTAPHRTAPHRTAARLRAGEPARPAKCRDTLSARVTRALSPRRAVSSACAVRVLCWRPSRQEAAQDCLRLGGGARRRGAHVRRQRHCHAHRRAGGGVRRGQGRGAQAQGGGEGGQGGGEERRQAAGDA